MQHLHEKAVQLLTKLISIPSFSREEDGTALLLTEFFEKENIVVLRHGNNIWVKNKYFTTSKPTVLLNSHHDTVKPNSGYTRDPFKADIIDGKLFGLGSNDAGGPLVSLIATFLYFYDHPDLSHNVILAATAEEEVSGAGGIESIWDLITPVDFAIVGEPTLCDLATAEKGLM